MTQQKDFPDDREPMLVMRDRTKGYVKGNVVMVSTRAGRIVERYTRVEMEAMLAAGEAPDGYTLDELREIAEHTIN